MYSVNVFMSNPSENNDDCITGAVFATLEEARACYLSAPQDGICEVITWLQPEDVCWLQLAEGEPENGDQRQIKARFIQAATPDDDSDWREEIAREAGMLGGCAAYNEVLGY
jgi:hypothetical protein